MLIGVLGRKKEVTAFLLEKAKTPALIIDCANVADPHRLGIPQERLEEYHVIPIELLYAFRDIAKQIPVGYKTVIITPIDILFNYHDEKENLAMYSQAWEQLRKSTACSQILIGITKNTIHEQYARSYCDQIIDTTAHTATQVNATQTNATQANATKANIAPRTHMGHTASSQRVTLGIIEQELRAYARSLPPYEKALFDKLMLAPAKHVGNITYASSLHVWAFLLISINLEQEKRLQLLEEAYEDLARRYIPEQRLDHPVDQAGIAQYQD